MLRHNHISENNEPIPAPDLFEGRKKKVPPKWVIKERPPLVATESYEVKITSTVETLRMVRHVSNVQNKMGSVCDR